MHVAVGAGGASRPDGYAVKRAVLRHGTEIVQAQAADMAAPAMQHDRPGFLNAEVEGVVRISCGDTHGRAVR